MGDGGKKSIHGDGGDRTNLHKELPKIGCQVGRQGKAPKETTMHCFRPRELRAHAQRPLGSKLIPSGAQMLNKCPQKVPEVTRSFNNLQFAPEGVVGGGSRGSNKSVPRGIKLQLFAPDNKNTPTNCRIVKVASLHKFVIWMNLDKSFNNVLEHHSKQICKSNVCAICACLNPTNLH